LPITTVVKVGGGLLADAGSLDTALAAIEIISRDVALLVVPGGGPFADVVRDIDRQFGLSDTAAHWMAILGMDQYAQLIASRLPNGVLVSGVGDIEAALAQRQLPVLAPYQWMREADPLPHSWDVTSDSIAAWVAGQVGASRLVLVKPSGASGPDMVDPCFDSVLRPHLTVAIVKVDEIDQLRTTVRRA